MLSPVGALVRRHDPDRFLCALFAPDAKREALFVLAAFNHELARAREAASEPGLALIRLQWWREVVEGAPRRHEVATPLRDAIQAGALPAPDLLDMIAMRESDMEGAADSAAWQALQLDGPGAMAVAAGRALGVSADLLPRLRQCGAGYGAAGTLRNALAGASTARLPASVDTLAQISRALLGQPAHWPRHALAAALPAILARRDLRRLPEFAPQRAAGDRLAVLWAGLRGIA